MHVEAYSSFAYAVEPRVFEYNGTRHRVTSISRMWRTPGSVHFYVRNQEDTFFELRFDEHRNEWTIRAFGETCPPK